MARFITLVLDGFGVGYMDDVINCRPQDYNTNTAKHILEKCENLKLKNLEYLGLMNILDYETDYMKKTDVKITGKSKLQHYGGDTFLGHQEIMGSKMKKPLKKPFSYYIDEVEKELLNKGYSVERKGEDVKFLWVNDTVAIGDNLETDLGQVYNVTTTFKNISFEEELEIAKIVRKVVKVARVIVFGGTRATKKSILAAAREKENKFMGIDAPKSGVYDEGYMVRHMGYGVNPYNQIPSILSKYNIDVRLIGKVADIVYNPKGKSFMNLVDTTEIFKITIENIQKMKNGFMCINIQETDLAGHSENVKRYAEILKLADKGIGDIMKILDDEDILVITADHGNDPTIGRSAHTRENVPILIYNKKLFKEKRNIDIGIRNTMSDTANTVLEYFGIKNTLEQGESYLKLLN